jgi:hypothetical protein
VLSITVLGNEYFDEERSEFVYPESEVVELEHSLAVLSRWEAKHEKPFLGKKDKTQEELLDYVRMMIQSDTDPAVISRFTEENFEQIGAYMNSKMTATWFSDIPGQARNGETITAELIYYWMSSFSIPLEFENRHINQLFTVIRIHSLKNQKPKKMSKAEALRKQRELNAQRQKDLGTRG